MQPHSRGISCDAQRGRSGLQRVAIDDDELKNVAMSVPQKAHLREHAPAVDRLVDRVRQLVDIRSSHG